MSNVPDRGDLAYLDFTPQAGHEQAGHRPAIVLSPSSFNIKTGFAISCPITSEVKGYPFEVAIPDGLHIYGVILSDQLKSLDWQARHFRKVDEVPEEIVQECLDKIKLILF